MEDLVLVQITCAGWPWFSKHVPYQDAVHRAHPHRAACTNENRQQRSQSRRLLRISEPSDSMQQMSTEPPCRLHHLLNSLRSSADLEHRNCKAVPRDQCLPPPRARKSCSLQFTHVGIHTARLLRACALQ
jgi:hypothetical protein